MTKTMIALSAALVAVAGTASAEGWTRDGVYGAVKAGITKPQYQKFDGAGVGTALEDGWTGGAAVGIKDGNMRAEVEGLYEESDASKTGGETTLSAAMVNGYYDFKNATAFTPYVGAGVGYAKVRFSDYGVGGATGTDDVMAYQGIAGVGYELNPCWTVTGEYRYLGTTKASTGVGDTRYQSHSALAGLRYTF